MSFEARDILWLLLPLAAASGWFLARYEKRREENRGFDLPSAYFKGLNFLLNEQPDKAIEVFIQVLEVNSETVETHLALGNLFRRRGEVERAIRIHQNLIARPTLEREQRTQALLELGQDYQKAGLYDRAENLFLELAEMPGAVEQALRSLLHIYQQEKDWDKAIAAARKLSQRSGQNLDGTIAQFSCELAEQALAHQNYPAAGEHAREALAADARCVRASLVEGDAAAALGNHREAIESWRRIEQQDPRHLSETAERIAASFRALGDGAGLYEYFQNAVTRGTGTGIAIAFARIVREREGVEAAEKFIVEWLRRRPNVHGLHELIALNLEESKGEGREDLKLLQGIIANLREQHMGYVCAQCGFHGRTMHWLCPGCNRWNTIHPVAG